MSDHTHQHYELRSRPDGGTSPWAWIVPALFAAGIILALAVVGTRGGTPDAVHPGGAGAPAVITPAPDAVIGADGLQPVTPAQPVLPPQPD